MTQVPDERRLAIFYWDEAVGDWQRVGGTVDIVSKSITTAVWHLSRYAIMYDKTIEDGSPSISEVNCQPRIFSPRGGGYDNYTTISFNLGKESGVTIKIYNGAGRLERTLKDGEWMGKGMNAVTWDGKDDDGDVVVSGLYIVTITAEGKMETKTVGVLNKY
jgi:hypothetical protein